MSFNAQELVEAWKYASLRTLEITIEEKVSELSSNQLDLIEGFLRGEILSERDTLDFLTKMEIHAAFNRARGVYRK